MISTITEAVVLMVILFAWVASPGILALLTRRLPLVPWLLLLLLTVAAEGMILVRAHGHRSYRSLEIDSVFLGPAFVTALLVSRIPSIRESWAATFLWSSFAGDTAGLFVGWLFASGLDLFV